MPDRWEETLKKWIKTGPPDATPTHEEVLMWGVWVRGIGDDEYHPPEAMFQSEEKAKAFAALFDVQEYDVSPCLTTIQNRDDFTIPPKPA